jgi:hypothetical protein
MSAQEWRAEAAKFLESARTYAAQVGDCRAAIDEAIAIAETRAMYDGQHHKQWVIDQMVRALLGEDYDAWVQGYRLESEWDVGVAP